MQFEHAESATPLDADEVEGLIPTHITTQQQLNAWEQENILAAERWLFWSQRMKVEPTREFLVALHRRMFDRTWRWAGEFRRTEKNIGIDPHRIGVAVRELCDDIRFWLDHGTYEIDEAAVRFHHRLVAIHLFADGNGRHARMVADALAARAGKRRFSWGSHDLGEMSAVRKRYIAALRDADRGDISPLLEFARS